MDVALLGTGLMGQPMARRLAMAGQSVTAYNRTGSKARALLEVGVRVAQRPAEALRAATHAILTLSDARAIREVVLEPEARAALAGRTVIQMGTIGPSESRRLRDEIADAGAEYFEAPVLGSIPEAREGKLIVMVGATPQQFEAHRELLRCFSPNPTRIGEVGQAAALKLAFNQLIASLSAGFAYSLALVRSAEVDVEGFMALLRASALYAPTFDKKLSRTLDGDFTNPNFPLKHLLKDVRLAVVEGRERGLGTDALAGIAKLLEGVAARGHGDEDYSALYRGIEPRA
jgi:3-hydroxyisobutyrate dehydrogenase-like beta-hydroxyacid dehydrogenase